MHNTISETIISIYLFQCNFWEPILANLPHQALWASFCLCGVDQILHVHPQVGEGVVMVETHYQVDADGAELAPVSDGVAGCVSDANDGGHYDPPCRHLYSLQLTMEKEVLEKKNKQISIDITLLQKTPKVYNRNWFVTQYNTYLNIWECFQRSYHCQSMTLPIYSSKG